MFQAGKYYGSIIDAVVSESRNKGTPQMVIRWNITAVFDPAQNAWFAVNPDERRTFWALTDGAWPYVTQKLQTLGFNGDFENPAFQVHETELECSHEQYNGQDQERWDIANWGGGGSPEKASSDKLKRLNAMWRNQQGSPPPPQPSGGTPAGNPAPPPAPAAPAAPSAPAAAPPAPTAPASAAPLADQQQGGTATQQAPTTLDEAWAHMCNAYGNEPDVEAWNTAVAAVTQSSGKEQGDFGPDEWAAVAQHITPF